MGGPPPRRAAQRRRRAGGRLNVGAFVFVAAVALAVFVGAHLVLCVSLVRSKWWRGLLALFVAPLAPFWGWSLGMRARTWVWLGALALYGLGVALASA
jgi:hypothetical protein